MCRFHVGVPYTSANDSEATVGFDCCQIDDGARIRKEKSLGVDGNIAPRRF